jgi:hypothetical protein
MQYCDVFDEDTVKELIRTGASAQNVQPYDTKRAVKQLSATTIALLVKAGMRALDNELIEPNISRGK